MMDMTTACQGPLLGARAMYNRDMTRASLVFLLILVPGCRPKTQPAASAAPAPPRNVPLNRNLSSGYEVERFFPLVDGNMYHYALSQNGKAGLMIATAARSGATRGELRMASGTRYFEYAPDGLRVLSPATGAASYALKLPISLGSSWHGEHNGTIQVTAVDAEVSVRAGQFSGCVTVVEARRGDLPARFETTFCPEVGIVSLKAAAGQNEETAELISHGPPVELGPDGVKVHRDGAAR